jgi:hypothetical protein
MIPGVLPEILDLFPYADNHHWDIASIPWDTVQGFMVSS